MTATEVKIEQRFPHIANYSPQRALLVHKLSEATAETIDEDEIGRWVGGSVAARGRYYHTLQGAIRDLEKARIVWRHERGLKRIRRLTGPEAIAWVDVHTRHIRKAAKRNAVVLFAVDELSLPEPERADFRVRAAINATIAQLGSAPAHKLLAEGPAPAGNDVDLRRVLDAMRVNGKA